MSWVEYEITPVSGEDQEFLQSYSDRVIEASRRITEYRFDRYRNQDKIFEIDLDLIGTKRSDLFIPDLPYTHIRQLVDISSELWKDEIYRCIDNKNQHINIKNVCGSKVKDILPYGLLYWSDYSISGSKLSVKTNEGEIYKFVLGSKDSGYVVDSFPNHSIIKLFPEEQKIEIKTSKNSEQPRPIETGGNIRTEQFTDFDCLVKLLSIYNTDQPAIQIDTPSDTNINYIELFNILGFHWKEPVDGTYLITTSLDYLGKIDEFLKQDTKERRMKDYYELFGYPKECGNRLDEINGCFDSLSGEEFVLYGLQNNVISEDLAKYVRYVPYQPKPTLCSVHTALGSTRYRLESIENSGTTLNNIKGYTRNEILENYKSSRRNYQWKTLDVANYLVNTY